MCANLSLLEGYSINDRNARAQSSKIREQHDNFLRVEPETSASSASGSLKVSEYEASEGLGSTESSHMTSMAWEYFFLDPTS